jgi:lysophospholipase L1-like esterase
MKFLFALLLILSVVIAAAGTEPITIFLAGDSTMAEKTPDKRPETGWGEMLQQYFDSTNVRIENHAKNGRSTRSFNDEKVNTDRYASPADYGTTLKRFVEDVRAKEAHPVLLTPVARRRFDEQGVLVDTHGEYPDVVRKVTAELRVPLIDMNRKSDLVLRKYGIEESRKLFLQLKPGENANYPQGVEDNTHFNPRGAEVMASLAVEGIRELKIPLTSYLRKAPLKTTENRAAHAFTFDPADAKLFYEHN